MSRLREPLFWGLDPLFWIHCKLSNHQIIHQLTSSSSLGNDTLTIRNGNNNSNVNVRNENTNNTYDDTIDKENDEGYPYEHILNRIHPIRFVEIFGYVVTIEERGRKAILYVIDDGSELLDCIWWGSTSTSTTTTSSDDLQQRHIQLGDLVKGLGKLDFPPKQTKNGRTFIQRRQVVLERPLEHITDPDAEILHWLQIIDCTCNSYSSQPFPTIASSNKDDEIKAKKHRITHADDSKIALGRKILHMVNRKDRDLLLSDKALEILRNDFDRNTFFDFESLITLHEIRTQAEECATLASAENSSIITPETILIDCLRKLTLDGNIYVLHGGYKIFGLITHEFTLGPAIMEALAKGISRYPGGMSASDLFNSIRADPRLISISELRMRRSLQLLLNASDIYEIMPDHYRCV